MVTRKGLVAVTVLATAVVAPCFLGGWAVGRQQESSRGLTPVGVPQTETAAQKERRQRLDAQRKRREEANRRFNEGAAAFQVKDYARAERLIGAALEYDPAVPEYLVVLGQVYQAQGKGDQARAAYKKAFNPPANVVSFVSQDPCLLMEYAHLCHEAGDAREANAAATRAFACPPIGQYAADSTPLLSLLPPFRGSVRSYGDFGAALRLLRAAKSRGEGFTGVKAAAASLGEAERLAKTDQARAVVLLVKADTLLRLWEADPALAKDVTASLARTHQAEKIYMEAGRLDKTRKVLFPILRRRLAPVYLEEIYGRAFVAQALGYRLAPKKAP